MMYVELLETIFQVFSKSKSKSNEVVTTINGKLSKIGDKYVQLVMIFTPIEPPEILEYKIMKKGGVLDVREHYHLIAEGEFVMITTYLLDKE